MEKSEGKSIKAGETDLPKNNQRRARENTIVRERKRLGKHREHKPSIPMATRGLRGSRERDDGNKKDRKITASSGPGGCRRGSLI